MIGMHALSLWPALYMLCLSYYRVISTVYRIMLTSVLITHYLSSISIVLTCIESSSDVINHADVTGDL